MLEALPWLEHNHWGECCTAELNLLLRRTISPFSTVCTTMALNAPRLQLRASQETQPRLPRFSMWI